MLSQSITQQPRTGSPLFACSMLIAHGALLQVERLTKQYQEIAALAAAAGLQLEDPLTASSNPAAPADNAAVSKGLQPRAMEVAEGDKTVSGCSLCVHAVDVERTRVCANGDLPGNAQVPFEVHHRSHMS